MKPYLGTERGLEGADRSGQGVGGGGQELEHGNQHHHQRSPCRTGGCPGSPPTGGQVWQGY